MYLDGLQLVLQHAPEALVEAGLLAWDHKGVGLQAGPRLLQVLSLGQNGVSALSWTWLRTLTMGVCRPSGVWVSCSPVLSCPGGLRVPGFWWARGVGAPWQKMAMLEDP